MTVMDEEFVSRAAPLLMGGYSVDSVTAAIAADDLGLLRDATCNDDPLLRFDDRVVRFSDHKELYRVFCLFVRAYEGDLRVQRVSHAYGDERIDFRDYTSLLFRVQSRGW